MAVIAETSRLALRGLQAEDADAFEAVFCDPEVMRYSAGLRDRAWIDQWIRGNVERATAGDPIVPYAVVSKASNEVIGYCGWLAFPDINGQPEIELGYRLARAHWGRGFATEAAEAACAHAFSTMGLSRLIALIDPGNVASIRVAENVGFHREAEVWLPGYDHADFVYSRASG